MAGSEDLEQGLIREVEGRIGGRLSRQQEEVLRVQSQISEMLAGLAERMTAEPDDELAVLLSEHLRRAREYGHREAAQSSTTARETSDMALLKAAVDDIDQQRSQADILNALVNRAASFAPRVAFFVVKNDRATGWRARGLEGTVGDDSIREVSLPLADDTVLGRVYSSRETWSGAPGANADDHRLTAKLGDEAPQRMVAVPLIARDKCVAVLYADSASLEGEAINLEALETLVRVTGMAVELLATKRPVPSGQSAAPTASPAAPPTPSASPSTSPAPSAAPSGSSAAASFAPSSPAPAASPADADSSRGASMSPQPAAEAGGAPAQTGADAAAPSPPEIRPIVEGAAPLRAATPSDFASDSRHPADAGASDSAPRATPPSSFRTTPVGDSAPQQFPTPPAGAGVPALEVSAEAREERGIVPLVAPDAGAAAASAPRPAPLGERRRFGQSDSELPVEVGEEERRFHQDARRFARLLVSEIKLYNEQKVSEGRERGDLYERLRETIDRSRQMYDKRVHASVAPRYDYFHHELVNTLAEGDDSKLGAGYPGATVSA